MSRLKSSRSRGEYARFEKAAVIRSAAQVESPHGSSRSCGLYPIDPSASAAMSTLEKKSRGSLLQRWLSRDQNYIDPTASVTASTLGVGKKAYSAF